MANSDEQSNPEQFESSLEALESIVTQLEKGDMRLEDALKAFEKGVELTRTCQAILKTAEQKVECLTRQSGEPTVEPFESSD